MSYERKSIANTIEEIDSRRIMLPSIQRKYVWEESQITKLMDQSCADIHSALFYSGKSRKPS